MGDAAAGGVQARRAQLYAGPWHCVTPLHRQRQLPLSQHAPEFIDCRVSCCTRTPSSGFFMPWRTAGAQQGRGRGRQGGSAWVGEGAVRGSAGGANRRAGSSHRVLPPKRQLVNFVCEVKALARKRGAARGNGVDSCGGM